MTPPMENESHPTSGNNSVDPAVGIMYGDSKLTPTVGIKEKTNGNP